MSTILLFDVKPEVSALLRERAGDHVLEDVSGEEAGFERLRSRRGGIDAVVLGPNVKDPVRTTRHLAALQRDLPVMILSKPDRLGDLQRSIQFTPYLSQAVYFESDSDDLRVAETFDELTGRLRLQRRYQTMLHSVRDRLSTEESLARQSQLYLSALMNHVPAGVLLIDNEGRLTEWNQHAATLFGIDRSVTSGVRVADIVDGAARDQLESALKKVANTGRNEAFLLTIESDSGTRYLETSAAPVSDSGSRIGTVLSVMDVSERVRLEAEARQLEEQKAVNDALALHADELRHLNEALRQSNEELEAFAYVASHDLQEPLRKINAFTDLLRADYGDKVAGDGEFYIERLQDASGRMIELIKGLLSYSRVASRGHPFRRIELNSVLRHVLTDLEVRIEETGAEVNTADLPSLEADPIQMRQLFQNLIGNSIKFRRKDVPPVIDIGCRRIQAEQREYAEITFKDNGIGFDMRYAARIFAPFQRLHGRGKFEGTGIGLAICRRIVQRHGGTIEVASEPEQGTRFTIRLPLPQ